MKKLILVYVVLIIAVILLAVFKAGGSIPSFLHFGGNPTAEIGKSKLNLIVVKNEKDRQKGLSGRKSINQNQGMLFIFDHKDRFAFWMKDMRFPIDIIYIDNNMVVYVVKNAPAPANKNSALEIYRPDAPANYVLEVNAGVAQKLNIQKGTTVNLKGI